MTAATASRRRSTAASSASACAGRGCDRIRAFPMTAGGIRAGAAALLAALVLALPSGASASVPPQLGEGASLAPHLLLIHGGSFLYEDPLFESLTRARAVAAGFVPHYLAD